MAKIFKTNKQEEPKKNGSSFWETVGGIALGAVYVAAAAASTQNEYNNAVRVMETIVPKYEGLRNRTIPTSEWDKLEHAEKVFAQHARTMDHAAENAAKIHAILLANRKFGSSYSRTAQTQTRQMSLAEAQVLHSIYDSKFGGNEYLLPRTIVLDADEKKRLFDAAVVLRENRRSYDADYLEAILAHA